MQGLRLLFSFRHYHVFHLYTICSLHSHVLLSNPIRICTNHLIIAKLNGNRIHFIGIVHSVNWFDDKAINFPLIKTFSFCSDNVSERWIIHWQIQYFVRATPTTTAKKKETDLAMRARFEIRMLSTIDVNSQSNIKYFLK